MHQVKQCCCGCSLKTGTLILVILSLLGILDFLGKMASPKGVPVAYLGFELIFIITAIPALYGTLKEQPTWLIPHLVAYVISLVLLVISMIAVLIFGQVFLSAIVPLNADPKDKQNAETGVIVLIIASEIIFAICAGLTYYFFVVIYSFYKQLKTKTGGLPA